jgi:hypothetical protein
MEEKFSSLPVTAGILFVSVAAQPAEDGISKEYHIRLGIQRRLSEETGKALIRRILEEEMKSGLRIYGGIYRGISGACRDDGTPTARSLAT